MHVPDRPKWPCSALLTPERGIPTWRANPCNEPMTQVLQLPQQTWQMLWASFGMYFFAIQSSLSWKGLDWRLYIKATIVFIGLPSV